MKIFVGPFLCFSNNNPKHWVGFIIKDNKVESICSRQYMQEESSITWEIKTAADESYYAIDVNVIAPNTQPFVIIIKDSNIYRIDRQKRGDEYFVNVVQRLQVNNNTAHWLMSPFHRATAVLQPNQSNELIFIEMHNLVAIDISYDLEKYKNFIPKYELNNREETDLGMKELETKKLDLLEDAIKELLEPQCFLVNGPRKKTKFLQVCFWRKLNKWVMRCDLNDEIISITLGDFAEDSHLLNFLNKKVQKKVHTCLDIHKNLIDENLLSYVSARLWGLSVYQQLRIKTRMELEDIWPIQPHLDKTESAKILECAWRSNSAALSGENKEVSDSIADFISQFQLLCVEQEKQFYLFSDREAGIATNARLKHVFRYVNVLLMLAATKLEITLSLNQRKISPEISEFVIGRALNYEIANDWMAEVLAFVDEGGIIWHDYSHETLLYFEYVFQNLVLKNPRYSELSVAIFEKNREQLVDENGEINIPDIYGNILPILRWYIKLYDFVESYTEDSAHLITLQTLFASYHAFIIILRAMQIEFFDHIKTNIDSCIETYRQSEPLILLEVIKDIQNSEKTAKIIQLLSEKTLEACIDDYTILIDMKNNLNEATFSLLLDKLKKSLKIIPINLIQYIPLFISINNSIIREKLVTLTRLNLSQAIENSNENLPPDVLRALNSLSAENFKSFILNLTEDDIYNLLKHSNFHEILRHIKQNEPVFFKALIRHIKPGCYKIFHNIASLTQILAEVATNNFCGETIEFIVDLYLQKKESFWELFALLSIDLKLSFAARETIKLTWLNSLEDIQRGLILLEPQNTVRFLNQLGAGHMRDLITSSHDFCSILEHITPHNHCAFLQSLEAEHLLVLHQTLWHLGNSCLQLSEDAVNYLFRLLHHNNYARHLLPSRWHHNLSEELEIGVYRVWIQIHRYRINLHANSDGSNINHYSAFSLAHNNNLLARFQNMLLFSENMAHPVTLVFSNSTLRQAYTEVYTVKARIYDYNHATSFSSIQQRGFY